MAQLMTNKGLYLMIQPLSDENTIDALKAHIQIRLPSHPENQRYLADLCHDGMPLSVQKQRLLALDCFVTLIETYLPHALPSLCLYRDEFGRPHASADTGSCVEFDFSLTHSQHYAGCALLSGCGHIGLDIEELIPMERAKKIAGRFFSESEQQSLRTLSEASDISLEATYIWTAKEAMAKQDGRGFPLRHDCMISHREICLLQGSIIAPKHDTAPAVVTICAPTGCLMPVFAKSSLKIQPRNTHPL